MSKNVNVDSKAPAKYTFVSRIRGARDVHWMTASQFAQNVQNRRGPDRKGDPTFTLQEHFNGETMVHPYYDYDAKYKKPFATDEAREMEEKARLEDFKSLIAQLHPGAEVVYGQRHGPLAPKDKGKAPGAAGKGKGKGKETDTSDYAWKISYRAWVQEIKIKVRDIERHARRTLKLSAKDVHPYLDLSVYKEKEQLLGVIYGCKDIDGIKRYLVPLVPPEGGTEPLTKFLAQNVNEADKLLTIEGGIEEAVTKSAKKGRPKKSQPVAADRSPVAQVGGSIVFEGADGKETLTPANDANFAAVLKVASSFFGGKYRVQENLKSILVNREKNCLIFPTTEKWCYIKEARHAGNNPYIVVTDGGSRWKCPDDICKQALVALIPTVELPKEIRNIFTQTFYAFVDNSLMTEAKVECRRNITDNFPDETPEEVDQVQNTLLTLAKRQTCKKCGSLRTQFEHHSKGYCIRCLDCTSQWPNGLITFPEDGYPKLVAALTQLNIAIGTVNFTVNNNYGDGQVDFYADFSSDSLSFFEDDDLNALFIGALQGTDTALSRFTTTFFKDRFHCTDTKRWFQFPPGAHCWTEHAADMTYREEMAKPYFLAHFQKAALHYENTPLQSEEIKRKGRLLRKLCINLEEGSRRDKIVIDSIMKFHERRPNFEAELNSQNVMVFQDGVFDFQSGKFGPGSPDRAITMCVPQPYIPFDASNEHVIFLLEFMNSLLPNAAVCDYVLKVLALALTTDTSQQFLWIFNGCGGNGKSKLMNLMKMCLGPYFQTLVPTFLTKKREDASNANEALMALIKTRLVVFQEPEATDVLQASTLKAITGEDTLSTRANYGKQVNFTPTWKSFLVTNSIPAVSEGGIAVWRRIRVVEFPMRFVENPDPTDPLQKKLDVHLDAKLKLAAPHFISILLLYNAKFQTENLQVPYEVTKATETYKSDCDVVKQFVEEKMVRDCTSIVHWTALNAEFKKYSGRAVKVAELRSELGKHGCVYLATDLKATEHYAEYENFRGFKGWRLLQ